MSSHSFWGQDTVEEIDEKFAIARRYFQGGVFVSHAGKDADRIREEIVFPCLWDRFAPAIFFHSRKSGGAESYKQLVYAALHWCPHFLVVVSRNTVRHQWVYEEVDWAVRHRRVLIRCKLDDGDASETHPGLTKSPICADFGVNPHKGRADLARIVNMLK